jgi:hypothetical protein
MLHNERGEYRTLSIPELKQVPVTPRGERSNRWQGIQHGELVETLLRVIDDLFGFKPIDPLYAVSPNGACMLGKFTLGKTPKGKRKPAPINITGVPHEVRQTIGFTHSNDSKTAFTLACGGEVMVCTNGMVVGSHTFKRRHTTGLYLYDWIKEQFARAWDAIGSLYSGLFHFNDQEVTQRMHDTNLLELGRRNIVNWNRVGQIDREWRASGENPEHPFFARTLWSWYNCVTEIIKRMPIASQFRALESAFVTAKHMLSAKTRKELDAHESDVIDAVARPTTPVSPSEDEEK